MPSFPLLSTGARVQFPFVRKTRFQTEVSGGEFSPAYTYTNDPVGLKAWELTFTSITDAEAEIYEDFFHDMRGAWDEFEFTDPTDGVTYQHCHFEEDVFDRKRTGPDDNTLRLLIEQTR